MTREEKIKGLHSLKEYLIENPIELEGHKSLSITLIDYAIEELEQKSILEKIRAEIEQITDTMGVSYNQYISKIDVLQIIDKYKAGSEVEDGNDD